MHNINTSSINGVRSRMYFESTHYYNEVPLWVGSMVKLGYEWERDRSPWKRRVNLISMPCHSVCAALVALGALRKDLEREDANNVHGHYEALCRACDAYLTNPDIADGIVIDSEANKPKKKWKFSHRTNEKIVVVDATYKDQVRRKGRLVANPNSQAAIYIMKDYPKGWRMEGDPIIEVLEPDAELSKFDYQILPGCNGLIRDENLRRSYSGLLLVGRGEGKDTKYMHGINAVSFRSDDYQISLDKLLTIHSDQKKVKRMSFCNQQKIDRQGKNYYLVVADGASAFLKSLSYFTNSDVIGVYSRDEPSENLENIAGRLGEIGRYYVKLENSPMADNLPRSIMAHLLERR